MEDKAIQIYGEARNRVYEKELKRLKEWKISARNKELITGFHNYLFSRGTKELRVAKVSSQLRRIALILNKDCDTATKDDIQNVVAFYNRQNSLSEASKSDYRRCIKQFFLWRKEDDYAIYSNKEAERITAIRFYQYIEKQISIAYKRRIADPATIITEDEVDTVIKHGCRTYKEKAMIKFLHETGVRTGELLGMKLCHIAIDGNYAKVTVNGKTGLREIPIVKSLKYLLGWLEIHPYKDNKNAFLWLGENPKLMHQPLHHRGARKLIDRCFLKAGIQKRHNLHWFRHSRASLLAPHLTEALLCKYLGWVPGSKEVKTYVHLCNQQLDHAYLKLNGVMQEEKERHGNLVCPSCAAVSDRISRYCFKCGRPLSMEIVVQDQEIMNSETNKTVQVLMEIAKNPELMKAFEKFKEEKKY